MRRGLTRLSSAQPTPSRSIVPGEKFSSNTSARRAISNSKARPRSCFRLRVIARLFELSIAIGKVVLLPGGARRRKGSPCGGSILMTSAPAFAINKVA